MHPPTASMGRMFGFLGGRCFFNHTETGEWRLVRIGFNRMLFVIGRGGSPEAAFGDYLVGCAMFGQHMEVS